MKSNRHPASNSVRVLAFAITLIAAGCGSTEEEDAQAFFDQGLATREAGDPVTATSQLKRAIALDPAFVDARWALAEIYLQLGYPAPALKELAQVSQHKFVHPRLLEYQLRALIHQRELDKAHELLKSTERKLLPTESALHAFILFGLNEREAAKTVLDAALVRSPANPEALLVQANIELANGEAASALALMEIVLSEQPNRGGAHRLRAAILSSLARRDEAIESLRRAQAVQPGNPIPTLELANELLSNGAVDEAEVERNKVSTRSATASFITAGIAVARGDMETGKSELLQALSLNATHRNSALLLAMLHTENGNINQAVDLYTRALGRMPRDLRVRRLLASLYINIENFHEAAQLIADGAKYHIADVAYQNLLTGILLKVGRGDEALQLIEHGATLVDESVRVESESLLAFLYAKMNRPDKALAMFEVQQHEVDDPSPSLTLCLFGSVKENSISRRPKSMSCWRASQISHPTTTRSASSLRLKPTTRPRSPHFSVPLCSTQIPDAHTSAWLYSTFVIKT